MIKKWLAKTTPFVILSVLLFIVLLFELVTEGGGLNGWRYSFLLRLFFFILAIILTDVLLKYAITQKLYWIWIIELFLCLGFVYYWIVS